MNSLQDKVTLITGAVSGIGEASARCMKEAGARLALADIQDGSELAAELDAIFIEVDVADHEAVEAMVARTVEHYGRLDVFVNNAGIEIHSPLVATTPEDHCRLIDVNLNGVYYGLQSAIRAMINNEGPDRGAIVNTASVAGLIGAPGLSSYNAAKGGVVLLTKNAALEVAAFGIRVNAVCPGIIRTPMAEGFEAMSGGMISLEEVGKTAHPMGRLGEAAEVAKLICFLASDDASFITGAAVPIDGGMTAGPSAGDFANLDMNG